MNILLLGSTGYIGQAFHKELTVRGWNFSDLIRKDLDYTNFYIIKPYLQKGGFDLVINCAAFIPKESVSLCDLHQSETIQGNVLFPSMLAHVCALLGITLAHISTGCLWSDELEHSESDPPQRAFNGHCGFYIGTKVLSENEVRQYPNHYIWRVRLPFDECDSDRNYLSKLMRFPQVWDHFNSIVHRSDFAKACLDLCDAKAGFGTYHVVNDGAVRAVDIVKRFISMGLIKKMPEIIQNKAGSCQLSIKKLLSAGVKIRSVHDALNESLSNWKAIDV